MSTCQFCNQVSEKITTCDNCQTEGCNKCIKIVCCDCSMEMCKDCRNDHHVKCGCYGTCNGCDVEVNRGEHGWPCHKCNKWLCDECKENTTCKECLGKEE